MASARDQELTDRFETFYRQHESDAIADLARKYPREDKSLEIDWQDLFRFDPDFAEDVISSPRTLLDAAEEALGRYDLPVDKDLSGAHVRVVNLPEATEIRAIRAEHLGTLVSVQGIVRKATSVKPKIERAAFECLRCGTITVVPQADGDFQDPYQCDGCEREGPFQFLTDHGETEFVDAQKLRIQESPEGLAGGETPESIDMHIEDDITGEVSPGDHVTATGILRLDDSDMESTDSRVFDMYLEGVDVVVEDEEFEEMEISDAEREEIIRLSEQPDIYEQLVDSVAPTIYGFDVAKLAIGLQLFSGVTKHLPDGARIRGDVHILLVGDPGTGKCVRGDTTVTLADGTRRNIRDLVESNLEDPQPVDDGVFARTDIPVLSMTEEGSIEPASATKVWKREAPETMYRVTLSDGSELEITPSHPLFTLDSGSPAAVTGEELSEGTFVAVPRDTDRETDVIPNVSEELTRIRTALALSQSECGVPRTTFQHYERGDRNPGRESLRTVLKTFESRLADLREASQSLDGADWDQVEQIRQDLGLSQAALADEIGVGQTTVSLYTRGEVVPDGGRVQDAREVIQERLETALSVTDSVRALSQLVEGDLAWAEITDIEAVEPNEEWVYDLEVEGTHSYLSNNVLSHNSQILQYIRHIAPRSVYTSGKGSSSAGLTAAAVRDDFGEGQQWSLEAGALVLADKGIAAVDELDKMACVTGDTLVSLGDGELERIGELSREAAAEGSIEELENGRTIRDVPDLSVQTMTEDGSIEERPVTAIHEYDAPTGLRKVTLESGESLTATPDHPFFVFEAGETVERQAEELSAGDWVFIPKTSQPTAGDGGVAAARGATSAQTTDDPSSVALAAVLGYLSGDGNVYYNRKEGSYGVRFINSEEELLSDFEQVAKQAFEKSPVRHPSEQRSDGVETVRVNGKSAADTVLDAGMNLQIYDGKTFPTSITDGGRLQKAAFVRALADSEGSVDTATGNVKIHSASRELLNGTKSVLRQFGVSAQIQHRDREDKRDIFILAITDAESLQNFQAYIGFTLSRKQDALDAVVESVDGSRTILDVIPEIGERLKKTREGLRLYQSESGTSAYGDFERGEANTSIHRATDILLAFKERKRTCRVDLDRLENEVSWDQLADVRSRYHVSQSDLAAKDEVSQQHISDRWGKDPQLKQFVRRKLQEILESVLETDVGWFESIVQGDVKWRRVDSVEYTSPDLFDDAIPILSEDLAQELDCSPDEAEAKGRTLVNEKVDLSNWEGMELALNRFGISQAKLAKQVGVDQSTISRWFSETVASSSFESVQKATSDLVAEKRQRLRDLLEEITERRSPKVYDLTVEGTHNFVANGMVVHNSDDRSAMHEALEQQSISISKAGINATLKSRCSLLGAANPELGRFDRYETPAEQIDLEPALISRFDLIFTVTDDPDEEKDANLAEHILRTNYAGELNTHRTKVNASNVSADEVDSATESVSPAIEPELMRKYIAYARSTCFPTMTEEAEERIREFYVNLRSQGTGEDSPVPVTARKLEAIVRLAEASARVRLSDTVELEDADRSLEIVEKTLKEIGMDPETGQYDADVIETGQSKSQRDRIRTIRELIADIEADFDEGAPIDEVLARAEEVDMDRSKAEHEIEKLKQKGEVYEPTNEHLRTT
ncbi:helix-turn-helix domain-containing protein [Halodesulfurarchaeum sp. HSR-GB]|uniref:LAGLIDADG family homing endonuclease n=1 Tax=Halodesulfurarchaeum sp. HSR-GB TaxID=3074077 RepID=UPI002858B7AA|nr:LAGLIDADG family homing endonuclease [Halodesulfurarchaeum sp. HSR-GB]MDR5656068.1 helix-turn-helix domain-containing protein [Halodesulfurarchaeum sp. HSR-GB]